MAHVVLLGVLMTMMHAGPGQGAACLRGGRNGRIPVVTYAPHASLHNAELSREELQGPPEAARVGGSKMKPKFTSLQGRKKESRKGKQGKP